MRIALLMGLLALLPAASPTLAKETLCDRQCMKDMVSQTLVSMTKHDPSGLPIAKKYQLTVNNIPSGLSMATPWRTVTGLKKPETTQYVIDTPRQEVFFIATVQEGEMPSLLWGRLKVEDLKISELELYLSRSKADSGAQFDADGPSNLPSVWSAPIPAAQRPSREELTRVAQIDFDPSLGDLDYSLNCHLIENGKTLPNDVPVVEWLKYNESTISKQKVEELKKAAATSGGIAPLGCPRIDVPTDKQARILVDEEQSIAVSLAIVSGKVFTNFLPPPGPDKELPTVFVPDSMKADQAQRTLDIQKVPAAVKDPVNLPMPTVLACGELTKYFDKKIQGSHRLMQAQPVGSRSPWVTK